MKNKITLNGKEITLPDKLLKQIREAVKEDDGFKVSQEYYMISICGEVMSLLWYNNSSDIKGRKYGNVFKTKEEAEEVAELRKAVVRVKNYIKDNFGYDSDGWADWGNTSEQKYCVEYDCEYKGLVSGDYDCFKIYSPIGYIKSNEECNKLIEDCKKDLLLIFGV